MTAPQSLTRRSLLALGATATALSGCSANDSPQNQPDPANIDTEAFNERGPITLAKGKDTTGKLQEFLNQWNSEHPDEHVTLVELPEASDEQRNQLINNAQSESDAYTVLGLDVVWTPEFAAKKWVVELPRDRFPIDALIPSTVDTATYFDRLYAVPFITNAELLFYRTDLLAIAGGDTPPATFDEMYALIASIADTPDGDAVKGFASQYAKYEGMTVQITGLTKSAGGDLFGADASPNANSVATLAGVESVKKGFDKGYIPKEALTYKEEEGRQAFQDGALMFHQNWPYVWKLAQATDGSSKVAGKIAVAPVPGIGGNPGASALGGVNYAISAFAKNKGTAADFIAFMVEPERQKEWALATAQAPANASVYEDSEVKKQFPFFPTLKKAIDSGTSRPQAVKYGEVTQAIQEAGYAIFSGSEEPKEALATLQDKLSNLE